MPEKSVLVKLLFNTYTPIVCVYVCVCVCGGGGGGGGER